ncbi:PAS domain-containing protein [Poseidonibacter ostreae]|jgi:PAS domain S-box-containing protein|uniref:PAS domain-containing protein n=1 Tax=Poseidonibacter ostreae TaxID=2654171 RepID=A0A6L4WQS9_9BACT|nr:PAS domain-containing protein [Poseidonibacter ostreae]KAB7882021.1 PAS domain-containing protein [Poseidonibacter ostreae]KAB7886877.1 PAS domain-containing protein [Poseidonibacter ostreae]KAB7889918.1 PAS domain-containing protein [Poseidonibacter ostreae]MAD40864.1 PAS sensor domain-containing protein [Arcobacter sp.]|tara:strand:- start:6473 stop:6871 length:399 start_codon:yes stop_codon:yes gene_type:complete
MGKEIVLDDFAFLVSETDEKGIIIFANDDFCKIAEYEVDELIGQAHSIVRHKDMPKAAFQDLWDTVKKGEIWSGYVKNATKSGNYYWVFATVFPTTTSDGRKGYLSCRRKASIEEINEHIILYKDLKAKESI